MGKRFMIGGVLLLAVLSGAVGEREFWRALRRQSGSEGSSEQRLVAGPLEGGARYRERESQGRREAEVSGAQESRPLCEEERRSLDVRELIFASASNFIQTSSDLKLRRYHLIPRKVDVIKCLSGRGNEESEAVCKAENCRERKVDVEVFGRLRNETRNVWEFVGTLSAVPVACECFVRWKPQKCSRAADVFYDL